MNVIKKQNKRTISLLLTNDVKQWPFFPKSLFNHTQKSHFRNPQPRFAGTCPQHGKDQDQHLDGCCNPVWLHLHDLVGQEGTPGGPESPEHECGVAQEGE